MTMTKVELFITIVSHSLTPHSAARAHAWEKADRNRLDPPPIRHSNGGSNIDMRIEESGRGFLSSDLAGQRSSLLMPAAHTGRAKLRGFALHAWSTDLPQTLLCRHENVFW